MPSSYRNMYRNVILGQVMRKSLWSILKSVVWPLAALHGAALSDLRNVHVTLSNLEMNMSMSLNYTSHITTAQKSPCSHVEIECQGPQWWGNGAKSRVLFGIRELKVGLGTDQSSRQLLMNFR